MSCSWMRSNCTALHHFGHEKNFTELYDSIWWSLNSVMSMTKDSFITFSRYHPKFSCCLHSSSCLPPPLTDPSSPAAPRPTRWLAHSDRQQDRVRHAGFCHGHGGWLQTGRYWNILIHSENLFQMRREMPDTRFKKVYTFNSARKSMSTIIPLDSGGYRWA